jgi:hypothetical protein
MMCDICFTLQSVRCENFGSLSEKSVAFFSCSFQALPLNSCTVFRGQGTVHSVFFGPFLSGCFFPPNDSAQISRSRKPTFSAIYVGTKVSLDAKSAKMCKN